CIICNSRNNHYFIFIHHIHTGLLCIINTLCHHKHTQVCKQCNNYHCHEDFRITFNSFKLHNWIHNHTKDRRFFYHWFFIHICFICHSRLPFSSINCFHIICP